MAMIHSGEFDAVISCIGVMFAPHHQQAADELIRWCDGRIAGYKKPLHVTFVEALPKTALGKIRKEELRQRERDLQAILDKGMQRNPARRYATAAQFEADLRIADQLARLWLEGGGGGNRFESYNLPWYFAARRTSIDCFEKRGRKGYLFTVGDEPPPPKLLAAHVRAFLGDDLRRDLDNAELLRAAGDLTEALHQIGESLEEANDPLAQVYVFTDLQARAFGKSLAKSDAAPAVPIPAQAPAPKAAPRESADDDGAGKENGEAGEASVRGTNATLGTSPRITVPRGKSRLLSILPSGRRDAR